MFLDVFDSLLEKHGLNKRQFSIKSGIPYTTIDGFYKKGYENIRLGTLRKIATFFDVSLDFLVFGKDHELPQNDKLTIKYNELNKLGKLKVDEYIEVLSESKKYTEHTTDTDAVFHTDSTDDDSAAFALQNTTVKN